MDNSHLWSIITVRSSDLQCFTRRSAINCSTISNVGCGSPIYMSASLCPMRACICSLCNEIDLSSASNKKNCLQARSVYSNHCNCFLKLSWKSGKSFTSSVISSFNRRMITMKYFRRSLSNLVDWYLTLSSLVNENHLLKRSSTVPGPAAVGYTRSIHVPPPSQSDRYRELSLPQKPIQQMVLNWSICVNGSGLDCKLWYWFVAWN